MKLESLVIANQHVAVNMFPSLVHTARRVPGIGSIGNLKCNREAILSCSHDVGIRISRQELVDQNRISDWKKVVTR